MDEYAFCRELLKQTMTDVRKVFSPEDIRLAWAWGDGSRNGDFKFHRPNGEYGHDLRVEDCRWSAAAEGWQRLLEALLNDRWSHGGGS